MSSNQTAWICYQNKIGIAPNGEPVILLSVEPLAGTAHDSCSPHCFCEPHWDIPGVLLVHNEVH